MSKNKHPVECSCQRTEREKQEALINQQKHLDRVRRLKAEGFSDPAMLDWKFENDNGRNPQMHHAHRYVEQWQTMRSENLGLLLWGGVGTGKSFLAGCIANALMEQEVPVRMTNFARILNELNNSFSGRNEAIDKLCRYPWHRLRTGTDLQHRRQPIPQPEAADRHHQPDAGRDTPPTGYRPCPHL